MMKSCSEYRQVFLALNRCSLKICISRIYRYMFTCLLCLLLGIEIEFSAFKKLFIWPTVKDLFYFANIKLVIFIMETYVQQGVTKPVLILLLRFLCYVGQRHINGDRGSKKKAQHHFLKRKSNSKLVLTKPNKLSLPFFRTFRLHRCSGHQA